MSFTTDKKISRLKYASQRIYPETPGKKIKFPMNFPVVILNADMGGIPIFHFIGKSKGTPSRVKPSANI